MKKAIIYYSSRKGTTKYFGEEIGEYLEKKNISVEVLSVLDARHGQVKDADIVLLGGWTHGLFIFLQHPDKQWNDFAEALPNLKGKKVGLFTTYKTATGSLFHKMEKRLHNKIDQIEFTLKSKGEKLLEPHKIILDEFLEKLNNQ